MYILITVITIPNPYLLKNTIYLLGLFYNSPGEIFWQIFLHIGDIVEDVNELIVFLLTYTIQVIYRGTYSTD